ncbi:signal peptidase I [Okibacterium sp. HSC-33S16]|uniref:signal peptidase I n=1 Tax=Okibacterium sp. HSC-33S16 TaxID=2910965 RepID=UPI0020A0D587|nr:signal peptidase I [Okibacterium sp. HSC-33S16]MCP2031442.1 signal peptidase I [Okibacterium sp. HSC-33S16]
MGDPVADATKQPSVDVPAGGASDGTVPIRRRPSQGGGAPSVLSRVANTVVRVVSWTVLIVCGLLIVGFVLVPRLTGSTPYTVLTGSMRPTMPPGTTVVVKPLAFSDIRVGDVITYQLRSGEPEVVTHRVIGINITGDGVRLETQGDANPIPDEKLVREEQVRGKAWYWLPVIGYVTNGVTSDTRTWLAQGLGVALIGYAVVTVFLAVVRRKSGSRDSENAAVDGDTGTTAASGDSVPVKKKPISTEQALTRRALRRTGAPDPSEAPPK